MPLTEVDYQRISSVNWSEKLDKFSGLTLFRPLKPYERENTPYTQAMKPGPDDFCPFLVDKLCFIHREKGSEFKPSMCQLFPYCFNETPSGVYVTVSFVSMAVIYNSGKALSEQTEYLEKKFADFCKLYPNHHPNWSKLQLIGGCPLDWDNYLSLEDHLISCLNDKSKPLEDRLIGGSDHLLQYLQSKKSATGSDQLNFKTTDPSTALNHTDPPDAMNPMDTSIALNHLDKSLLLSLHKLYFPAKAQARGEGDFSPFRFFIQSTIGSRKIKVPGASFTLQELAAFRWPKDDQEMEDILYRYFFSRIFAKLYFGAGFGQLSLIVGFHHLALLLPLIKLHARALAIARGASQVELVDLIATIRQLEKRLGDTTIGPYAAATLELLLFSPRRLKRILARCT